jgi:competence protein ComEC
MPYLGKVELHRTPILRLVLPFIAGIVFNSYFLLPSDIILYIGLGLLFTNGVVVFSKNKLQSWWSISTITGAIIYSTLFFAGVLAYQFSNPTTQQHHITHKNNYDKLLVRVLTNPEPKPKTFKVIANVEKGFINDTDFISSGKIIMYLSKKGCDSSIRYGDYLLIRNKLKPLPTAIGEDSFNYAKYLAYKNIYYQAFLYGGDYQKANKNKTNPILKFSHSLQKHFNNTLQNSIIDSTALGVANALIIGEKNLLDDELKTFYANTGTIHILAVSGLHVGAIYLALLFVLGFLPNKQWVKWLKAVALLCGLWLYALVTGLSPSVVRATTMFSFIAFGDAIGRKTNLFNSLVAAALFTLAIDAKALFQVGFQLSYLAVMGIGLFYKPLIGLLTPKTWVFSKAWQLLCVSFAAQLATFPLVLYYFHQFPTFFLLSNLLVVPIAMVSVYLGLMVLATSPIALLSKFLGKVLNILLSTNNHIVEYIEGIPFSFIDGIYIPISVVLLLYVLIGVSYQYLSTKKALYLMVILLTLMLIIVLI